MRILRVTTLLSFSLALLPRHASAQKSVSEKALASQLFDEAKALVKAGHVAEACPKFAESHRLDAQLGTLIHLANCYEKVGKTASAWALFREAAGIAEQRKDKREALAKERRAGLEAVLSKVKLDVPQSAPTNMEVQQDEITVGRVVWGSPLPVDPGTHKIRVRAEGYKDWTTTIEVPKGPNVMRVAVPPLEPLPATTAPVSVGTSPTASNASKPSVEQAPSNQPNQHQVQAVTVAAAPATEGSSWQTISGYVAGGLGLVGIGIGTYFVLRSRDMQNERNDMLACTSTEAGCSDVQNVQLGHLEDVIRNDNRIALGGFVAGGALVATGLVLVLTAPPSSSKPKMETKTASNGARMQAIARALDVRPWALINGAGVGVGGRW